MKKLFKFFALALMAVVTMSCSEEKSDVLYQITVVSGTNQTMGSSSSDSSIYDQVITGLKTFDDTYCTEWKTSIKDGETSKADKDALSRYETAEEALKKLEADWQTQIKNNTNPDVKMFELSRTLELKRYVGSTGETSTLKSYSISLSLK